MADVKHPLGSRAGTSTYTKVGSAKTRSTAEKLSDLAAKGRMRASTNPPIAVEYHDIRAYCLYFASTGKNEALYKHPISQEVVYRLESMDNFTLEKCKEGTWISW